ncbi:MAG: glycoside hydrolase family 43 protein, partial [Rufibacter sp.]
MRKIVYVLFVCLVGVTQAGCKDDETPEPVTSNPEPQPEPAPVAKTYKNPVLKASSDPQVQKGLDGKFYLYRPDNNSTHARFAVYSSPDLVTWTSHGHALEKASTDFWSGGSHIKNNTYYLYYTQVNSTTNRSIGVATSPFPTGPFTNHGIILNKARPVIDPAVFEDPATGKLYMYYAEGVGDSGLPELWVDELAPDGLSVVPGTAKKVISIDQAWENINIEHPLVFYAPNAPATHRYYMIYNGSGGHLARYAIGYAYSSSPTGPFTKAPAGNSPGNNPLVKRLDNAGIYGPGAPNPIFDKEGGLWLVYRIKTSAVESWSDRVICLDKIER